MSDVQGLTEPEKSAALFWAYEHAKARWRRHNNYKPTRRVRRVIKRKGKGKGKHPTAFLASMSMQDMAETFVGFGKGKGKSKGKSKSTGMGSGRNLNPMGNDGRRLRCHRCGSEQHLIKDCTQPPGHQPQQGRDPGGGQAQGPE